MKQPIKTYQYWMPGGNTGQINAESPYDAAQGIFKGRAQFCSGSWAAPPYVYVNYATGESLKLWEARPAE